MILSKIKSNKRGQLISGLVSGIISLVILVVIGLVVVATVLNANLLGAGEYNDTAQDMAKNLTAGIQNVSAKLPTILLIAAVVLLFGVLVFLVVKAKMMTQSQGGGQL